MVAVKVYEIRSIKAPTYTIVVPLTQTNRVGCRYHYYLLSYLASFISCAKQFNKSCGHQIPRSLVGMQPCLYIGLTIALLRPEMQTDKRPAVAYCRLR